MKKNKNQTLIYEDLGFPIRLINVPMRKVLGEWALDINLNHLQCTVLHALAVKPVSLSGAELRFIRHYFEMSTHSFAKLFGVTHAAVIKWERDKSKMNFATETWVRLYVLNSLKVTDKEFRKMYLTFNPAMNQASDTSPLEIDADKIAC